MSLEAVMGRMHVRRTAALTLLGVLSQGCSFLFTKAPQPNGLPSPQCSDSYAAPIADTVVTALSVAAIVAGSIVDADAHHCGSGSCVEANQLAGTTAILAGAVGVLLFTPSTVLGYSRTSACRAWLEGDDSPRPGRASDARSALLVLPPKCSQGSDAPLRCSSETSWGTGP
jgi:hypothetical protein